MVTNDKTSVEIATAKGESLDFLNVGWRTDIVGTNPRINGAFLFRRDRDPLGQHLCAHEKDGGIVTRM